MDDGRQSSGRSGLRRLATWATLCLACGWAPGCDVRDEPVRDAGGGIWSVATPRPDAIGPERSGPSETEPEYVEGYDAAARLAAAERRPLLVVFGASWCHWSGALARGPLADRAIVARSRRCVCVFVDADRDAATCRDFGVTAFPTLLVVDAEGQERYRATGATGATGLAAALDAVGSPGAAQRRFADDGRRAEAATDVTR